MSNSDTILNEEEVLSSNNTTEKMDSDSSSTGTSSDLNYENEGTRSKSPMMQHSPGGEIVRFTIQEIIEKAIDAGRIKIK